MLGIPSPTSSSVASSGIVGRKPWDSIWIEVYRVSVRVLHCKVYGASIWFFKSSIARDIVAARVPLGLEDPSAQQEP